MSKITTILKGNIRIYVTEATDIVQEAINAHQTKPLGSLIIATAISTFGAFVSLYKGEKTFSQIKSNGVSKTILVETKPNGDIRALIGNPFIQTETDNKNFNNIPLPLGIGDHGTLKIARKVKERFFGGEVQLVKSDIVSDLAFYFKQSEQIYSAVVCDVSLETSTKIKKANSVIFQMLPNHIYQEKIYVEKFIKDNKLSKLGPEEYIKKIDGMVINEKNIRWKCGCSQEKMRNIVKIIPKKEQQKIIEEYGKIEVKCNYCNKTYLF